MTVQLEIADLVEALPEIYQPIYGYPALSRKVSRACDDRLAFIAPLCAKLAGELGRPLRILDLGCAQGYIALTLAAAGAIVLGVDSSPENILVCERLAAEHPELQIEFRCDFAEALLWALPANQYDLILGLSIFHHVTHAYSLDFTKRLLARVAERVPQAIFELALATEPPAWAASQPADERAIIQGYAFVHEIGRVPTHLSEIKRPLIFASNEFWSLGDDLQRFTQAGRQSHRFVGATFRNTRRYFLNETTVAKVFLREHDAALLNLTDLVQESNFLTVHQNRLHGLPAVLSMGCNVREAWLVRERIPGRLLLDAMFESNGYDAKRVLGDILAQLTTLEEIGLYHADLRIWNVLIKRDGGATVIDFGTIVPRAENCNWPNNIFLAFWNFVWCTVTKTAHSGLPLLAPCFNAGHFPSEYQAFVRAFWRLPTAEWSFARTAELFREHVASAEEAPTLIADPKVSAHSANSQAAPMWPDLTAPTGMHATGIEVWMKEMESYLRILADAAAARH
jgi:O-antigen chain-terminating methyltransferase